MIMIPIWLAIIACIVIVSIRKKGDWGAVNFGLLMLLILSTFTVGVAITDDPKAEDSVFIVGTMEGTMACERRTETLDYGWVWPGLTRDKFTDEIDCWAVNN